MNKKILIGSIIVVALIVLSSFSSVVGKVSSVDNDELVEFDVEFCGLGEKHTVKLTQEEADEVEQLFDDIEQRLSEVETREEAEEIFKEAVIELDRYGLLGGLSIRQAKRLVTRNYKQVEEINQKFLDDENFMCLIAGHTTNTNYFGPVGRFGELLSSFFFGFSEWAFLNGYKTLGILSILFVFIGMFLMIPSLYLNIFIPYSVLSTIGIGGIRYLPDFTEETFSADGWISAIGVKGSTTWNAPFYGQIPTQSVPSPFASFYFPGVAGFTGVKLMLGDNEYIYLGSACWVKLGSEPPHG